MYIHCSQNSLYVGSKLSIHIKKTVENFENDDSVFNSSKHKCQLLVR